MNSGTHVLKLLLTDIGMIYTKDQLEKCINITSKKIGKSPEYILDVLLDLKSVDGPINNFDIIVKYGLEQVLVSRSLFRLFDKYGTVKITKSEYSGAKGEINYLDDVFEKLNIRLSKYANFLDLCCNPGTVTLYILNNNKNIRGIGLTLHPKEGGYKTSRDLENHPRFKILFRNLLQDSTVKFILNNKADFANTSCFIGHNRGKGDLVNKLYSNSYIISMNNLNKGGDLLNLLSFKWDYELLLNTIALLKKSFNTVSLYKSPTYTAGLSNVYMFCESYNGNFILDIVNDYNSGKNIYNNSILQDYSHTINKIFGVMNHKHLQIIEMKK